MLQTIPLHTLVGGNPGKGSFMSKVRRSIVATEISVFIAFVHYDERSFVVVVDHFEQVLVWTMINLRLYEFRTRMSFACAIYFKMV